MGWHMMLAWAVSWHHNWTRIALALGIELELELELDDIELHFNAHKPANNESPGNVVYPGKPTGEPDCTL
jgi:hypothetical protein